MPLPARITLDMSIDEEEFRRIIRILPEKGESLHELPPRENAAAWLLQSPAGTIRIGFFPAPPRSIGSLRLPRARVELDLAGIPAPARPRFVARFRCRFQRGGG